MAKDAEVLRDVCKELEIPVSIERSQSGNGAHVWFFFEDAVLAKTARWELRCDCGQIVGTKSVIL